MPDVLVKTGLVCRRSGSASEDPISVEGLFWRLLSGSLVSAHPEKREVTACVGVSVFGVYKALEPGI